MPNKKSSYADIIVLGGGAAGMMAAIQAKTAAPKADILILEKNPRLGKKLLMTGNGRCNLSNLQADSSYYHGSDKNAIQQVLQQFPPKETIDFFAGLGLFCRAEDDCRIYPRNGQASSVLDCLRLNIAHLGIESIYETVVSKVSRQDDGFLLESKTAAWHGTALIISGGGKAAAKTGSDGSALALLTALGQPCTEVFPALGPISVSEAFMPALKGVRAAGKVTLLLDDKPYSSEEGEIQFTEQALSGICVFDLSREVNEFFTLHSVAGKSYQSIALSLDLLPDITAAQLLGQLQTLQESHGHLDLQHFLAGLLHKRIAAQLLKSCTALPLNTPASELSPQMLDKLCCAIKDWRFTPTNAGSFATAQATAGGALLSGFELSSLQSKLLPGLFAAGEVLDVDGRCGGFNLQWAWSSGTVAGRAAAAFISQKNTHKRGS